VGCPGAAKLPPQEASLDLDSHNQITSKAKCHLQKNIHKIILYDRTIVRFANMKERRIGVQLVYKYSKVSQTFVLIACTHTEISTMDSHMIFSNIGLNCFWYNSVHFQCIKAYIALLI
jgi:hypothetical protein